MLIALGFVSESTIAQALATQHGGLLKTEYGFATGFNMSLEAGPTAAPPISPPVTTVLKAAPEPEPAAATVIPLHQTADAVPLAANPALEAAQAEVTVAHVRIVELEGELAAAQARSGEEGARIAELETEVQRERERADAAEARIAELEQAVAKARDERASAANAAYEVAQAHVSAADARVAELEQELTAVRQGESALRAELRAPGRGARRHAERAGDAQRRARLDGRGPARRLRAAAGSIESAPQAVRHQRRWRRPQAAPSEEPPAREPGQRQAAFAWQS